MSTDTITQLAQGIPVEIANISRELAKLWKENEGAATRASMMNLAIVAKGAASLTANTALIAQITLSHACRAILVTVDPDAPAKQVRAWISAHCHLGRAGEKHVCSEQITFLLEGATDKSLPNILFSQLDSDLPLTLWWQEDFPEQIREDLWRRIDRVVFDSAQWRDPVTQFAIFSRILVEANPRLIPCDLNWARILHLRQALSQIFNPIANRELLSRIEKITLSHAAGHRATAVLFIAWLAAQLRWKLLERTADGFRFSGKTAPVIEIAISENSEKPSASISRIHIQAADTTIDIQRESGSAFYQTEIRSANGQISKPVFAAGSESIVALFNEELARGGTHRIYLASARIAKRLFQPRDS